MSDSSPDTPGRPVRPPLTRLEMGALLLLVGVLCAGIGVGVLRARKARPNVSVILDADRATYRIAINDATPEELTLVPGIGRVRAQRIIEHRDAHGPFASFDDLAAVSGISRRLALALEDYCTLRGDDGAGGGAIE